jgi:hypothetical protein
MLRLKIIAEGPIMGTELPNSLNVFFAILNPGNIVSAKLTAKINWKQPIIIIIPAIL